MFEGHDVVEGGEAPELGLAEAFAGFGVVIFAEDGVFVEGHVEEAGWRAFLGDVGVAEAYEALEDHVVGGGPGGAAPVAFVVGALVVVGFGFGVAGDGVGEPEFFFVEQVVVDDAFGAVGGGGAAEEGHEVGGGFDENAAVFLFVAVVVEAVFFVPEGVVDQLGEFFGVGSEGGLIGFFAEVSGDDGHGLEFAHEIGGQVDAFDFESGELAGAAPLVVGAGGVGGIPDGQAIVVGIVAEPFVEVFFQAVVVGAVGGANGGGGRGIEPGVVIFVLAGAQDYQLGEEGFEVLAVALLDEAAVDVAVGLLAVEKFLEVGETVRIDAEVGEVEVFEIEIPVVELVVGIAGEEGAGDVADRF